jgi:Na+-transporting NADH:ubiquinone oxidoreductase subunit E
VAAARGAGDGRGEVMELNPFVIFFAAIFTNNILLANFLGMCPFLACSTKIKPALGLGAAVIFVMTCTSGLSYLLFAYILEPLGLGYLRTIAFIILIAAFVQFVEIVVERVSPVLYTVLGIFLPLITVNCAILGTSLFLVIRKYTFWQSLAFGLGGGIGWAVAIVAMAGIRQRMNESRVPAPLRGPGIALIIAGIMAMAFTGFSGMIQIQ